MALLKGVPRGQLWSLVGRSPLAGVAVVAAAACALYARTLGFGFSYVDDDVLIVEAHQVLAEPASLGRAFARPYLPVSGGDHAYYRPLVNASLALDAQRSGGDPSGYRVTNLVLHALAAALLLLWLRRCTEAPGVALLGALVFAVHPALSEAVAWVPGRNDSLVTLWALASWLALMRARAAAGWRWRLAHLAGWLLALLSKEAAVVLPFAWVLQARWVERRPWREAAPPWLLAGWAIALAIYLTARRLALPAGWGLAGLSAAGIARAPSLLAGDLGKLALPVRLSVLAVPEDTWRWPGVVAAGLLLAAFRLPGIRRAQLGFALVCLLLLIAPSLPASTLLTLETRLYLPAIAFILVLGEIARALPARAPVKIGVAAALVLLLGARAWVYSADFQDRTSFARAAVRESPHSSLAHRALGVAMHLQGSVAEAQREYQAALAEDAGEPIAHNNLAVILMAQGQLAAAEGHLRQELALNPRYRPAHRNLARVLHALGRDAEAAPAWEASLGLGDADREALAALVAYYQPRDPVRAARFRALLETGPAARSP